MYQYLDAAMVRAPACQLECQRLAWPDLTGPDAGPASWRAWLARVWQAAVFSCAVEAASPDLARRVSQILAGRDVPEPAVRRAVLSTLKYLLRASSRATPFGLLAGAAPARIGIAPALRAGTGHRGVARADAAWVAGAIERLEADARLRPHLTVTVSNLVAERHGHLVIEHRSRGAAGGAPERVQIRATQPVLATLEAASCPVRVADLTGQLAARFPAVSQGVIGALIAGLMEHRFLVTSLRSPMTARDPLAALLTELAAVSSPDDVGVAGLHAVAAGLVWHDAAPGRAAARDERVRVSALMTGMRPAGKPALAIDLRLDWDLMIPRAVATEAASAASVLARLARRPALNSGWTAWHRRFLERYGPGAVVPVLDVVDAGTGLGYPAGYLGSPYAAPAGSLTDRDKALLTLAQTAALRGNREMVLDETMVGKLAVIGPGDPVQPSTELTVRIHAANVDDLGQGRFTLHVTGVSRAAGATTGRFLGLLGAEDHERMSALYAALPGVHRGALLAQISAVPLYVNAENVARAPQAAGLVISLGEYREPAPGQVPLTDLAVTADARRLHLVSMSRRRPVHAMLLNAVDLAYHSHPLARFLAEAPVALAAPCAGFEWGAASALPFLPALRYGRTVVSPARWILTTADLPGRRVCWQEWDDALSSWREHVRLPERIYLGEGDQCVRLDMAEPSHRALLRAHLERAGDATLRIAPGPQDLRWAGGHVHEIVIPMAVTSQAIDPVRWAGEITGRGHGHLPGCDGRLYLKLYGPRDQQDSILTRHLPSLASQLGNQVQSWFVRYDDPEEHVRLRLALLPAGISSAAEEIGAWTRALQREGLVTHVSWDTYYPETARFGGATVMSRAEELFAADSSAVLAQLAACAGSNGLDARALTSASLADITIGLIGDEHEAMRWLAGHTKPSSSPPPRALYDQAVALVNPPGCHIANAPAVDANVAASWLARRAALAAYRSALERAGTIPPLELLPDLLHLHHARMSGPDLAAERGTLHLARAAALSRLARGRKAPRS
ncbi:MAG: lantibiotic dehydratase [Streptosporangiaceae bacterium]